MVVPRVIAFLVFVVPAIDFSVLRPTGPPPESPGNHSHKANGSLSEQALRFFDPMTAPIPVRPLTRFPLETMAAKQHHVFPCRADGGHLDGRISLLPRMAGCVDNGLSGELRALNKFDALFGDQR